MDPRKRHNNLTESLNPKQSMVNLELPSVRQTQELQLQNRSTRSSSVASLEKQGDTSCFGKLKACLGFKVPSGDRTVFLGRDVQAQKYQKNIVKNQKYSVLSLVPVVLYHQFKYFFNLFYLIIALSQFVPALKVGFLFTYVGPLGLVLGLTMLKEGYDDFKRYQRDKEANSALYTVLKPGGVRVQEQSCKLKVGDIIELTPAQRVPADLVLLHSTEENGTNFIKTDQLDGETDWKLRRAIRYTQEFFSNEHYDIEKLDASISCKGPSENIYHFEGVFEARGGEITAEPLFLEHTVWADTKITAGKALGVLIYSGRETRIVMNSRQARSKAGKLEMELNFISKILFVIMLILSTGIVALNGFYGSWPLQLFRYLLLLSSIIPISLRVNLDFAKVVFSLKINTDKTIPGTIARNSTIPEELGRISYLLTDKTGTLTKNEMYFRKLVMEGNQYEVEHLPQIIRSVKAQCEKYQGPLQDVEERAQRSLSQKMSHERSPSQHQPDNSDFIGRLSRTSVVRREKDCILRDLATAISVCHNVTPVIEDGEKSFHASSPDEIALVKFAQDIKMKLLERNNEKIVIENAAGNVETFRVIANFPFSSETKRMGILLRHETTQRVIFYLKGADTVISPRVKEVFRALLLDECENLARTGLRTMVFAQRMIKEEEFAKWKVTWDEANLSLNNRDEKMRAAANLLEVNMDFVGITGVEDLLQDDINDTIESLRNAGIKIWMLTGDKVETAKCIAISTGLKHANDEIFEIKDVKDDLDLSNKLNQFSNECNNKVLLIDGAALTKALENNRKLFFESAVRAPAVICSRCLPNQKAIVAEMVKSFSKKRVACIGDGGNDVGMIQSGDIGIGIVGKEGKQASLASDFSIMEFKALKALVLWHGRLYYKNSAKLSQFIIHRGLIISFLQMFFTLFFYNVAIQIYNGFLMLGYSTVYTSLPVFSLVFDEDINREHAYNYPVLYKTLQKSRELNLKTFLVWMWKSIFQAAVIMVMAIYLFPDTFLRVTTITFTALILSELLNVYTELNKLHRVMVYSLIGTVAVYFLSIIFFKQIIDVDTITLKFMGIICIIVAASWLPLHIMKMVMRYVAPSDYQKIMKKF